MSVDILAANLTQPALAFFALGVAATRLRSDLTIPEVVAKALSLYLLIAIGFKGGVQLRAEGFSLAFLTAGTVALGLSILLPVLAFGLLRRGVGLARVDAAAIAAHYGSVSVVTFIAATAFLSLLDVEHEGFMVTLLALMEAPAIVLALLLARGRGGDTSLRGILTSGHVLLLLGAIGIGLVTGQQGYQDLEGFLVTPFKGVLAVFLLDMGLVAARYLGGFRDAGWRLVAFGVVMPLIGGGIGVLAGALIGLSLGGTTLLGVLAASASYIAAPAAMRHALPEANPSLYLGLSLGVTFPFNLVIGIPLVHLAARALA